MSPCVDGCSAESDAKSIGHALMLCAPPADEPGPAEDPVGGVRAAVRTDDGHRLRRGAVHGQHRDDDRGVLGGQGHRQPSRQELGLLLLGWVAPLRLSLNSLSYSTGRFARLCCRRCSMGQEALQSCTADLGNPSSGNLEFVQAQGSDTTACLVTLRFSMGLVSPVTRDTLESKHAPLITAGNLVASLAMVAVVSYAGVFGAANNSAAAGIAVMKTSLPFGVVREPSACQPSQRGRQQYPTIASMTAMLRGSQWKHATICPQSSTTVLFLGRHELSKQQASMRHADGDAGSHRKAHT